MKTLLKHHIENMMPRRLAAMGEFEMALSLVKESPESAKLECYFDGKLKIEGRSSIITSSMIEMGIVHARVLMEFLGVRARNVDNLVQISGTRTSDINIESFGIPKLTVEQVLSPCSGEKKIVERNFSKLLIAANKLIAHSTDTIKIDNDSIDGYFMVSQAIPVLFDIYFYKKLGLEMPKWQAR